MRFSFAPPHVGLIRRFFFSFSFLFFDPCFAEHRSCGSYIFVTRFPCFFFYQRRRYAGHGSAGGGVCVVRFSPDAGMCVCVCVCNVSGVNILGRSGGATAVTVDLLLLSYNNYNRCVGGGAGGGHCGDG